MRLDDGEDASSSPTSAGSAPASSCWAATRATTTSRRGSASSRSSADFTAEHLRELARGRRAPAKAFLLNQERIAGVGNIYADEALFIARIHPLRPVGTLRGQQFEALREAVVEVARGGHRRARRDDRRLPPRRRRERRVPGPLPGPPARGRAVRALRGDDQEDPRGRARDLRLPALPARAARALGGEQVLEDARRGRPRAARGSRRSRARRRGSGGTSSGPVSATSSARPSGSFARLTSS